MRADDYLEQLRISRIWRRFGYQEPKDISKITERLREPPDVASGNEPPWRCGVLPTIGVYGKRFSITKQELILYSLFLNRVIERFKLQPYFTDFFNTHISSLSKYLRIKELLIRFVLQKMKT